MERKTTEPAQEPPILTDGSPDESEGPTEAEKLKAENERFWQAIERYAPQFVDILAEHGDTELLAAIAQRLSNNRNNDQPPQSPKLASTDLIQEFANETATHFVDLLFASPPAPSSEALPADQTTDQREAGRMEEYARQQAVRRSTVERGSPERREPTITLDPKAKEIAQAFGISEDKLARAAAERLRRKGVLRS